MKSSSISMPKHVQIPYAPRRAFLPFHNRTQRWACLVAHRRAGKTVAAVNEVIKAALQQKDPYAYFAPYRSQAKSVAWDYFKHYSLPVKRSFNEAELKIELITGSTIQLFGADNADAARGMGFRLVYCDEYGDFRPSVWGNVIRPTLSDRQGKAVFSGTPKGHNQFYDMYRFAQENPAEWFVMTLKASASGILAKEELEAARRQLSEDQYNQEYECSFDAAILGAFYGKEMMAVDADHRICSVPYDPAFPVYTAWDLGYTDDTAIIFYQNIANEIHILDAYSESGGTIEDYREGDFRPGSLVQAVLSRPYQYARHWLPHDARAKTLASGGKSIVEKLGRYLGMESLAIVPQLSIEDGIQAARTALARCYFDHKTNLDSLSLVEALRQYQREYDEDKKVFRKTPLHNWASHQADAFRMLAVAEQKIIPQVKNEVAPAKTVYTMTLDELWEYHEERVREVTRI